MSSTIQQINELAQKPNITLTDRDRLRELLARSRVEQEALNTAFIAAGKAEEADRRRRARAAGLTVKEQFIADNEQRFIDTAINLGNLNSLTKQGAILQQQKGNNQADDTTNKIGAAGASAATQQAGQIADTARGRLALKNAIKAKAKELADAKARENDYRQSIQQDQQAISEANNEAAAIDAETQRILALPAGQRVTNLSDFMASQAQQALEERGKVPRFQERIALANSKLTDVLDEIDTITKELKALTSQLDDIERNLKNLTGTTAPKLPTNADTVTDTVKQDAQTQADRGFTIIDDTGRILNDGAKSNSDRTISILFTPEGPAATGPRGQALIDTQQEFLATKPATQRSIFQGAIDSMEGLIHEAFKPVEALMQAVGRITPNNALSRAFSIAGAGMLVNFGIYTLATATDLLHPLKGTGIVPVAIDIARGIGPDLLSRTTVQAFADTALSLPIRYRIGELARGFRPSGALIDQMYFEGHITLEVWRQAYRWQGWPEEFIDAQYKTMFIEPSDRLLVGMFEVAGVPEDWIRTKLKERGYNREDIEVISKYGKEKVIERAKQNKENLIITRVKEGFTTSAQANDELLSLGFTATQARRIIVAALLARDTEMRKDRIAAATSAFLKDALDRPAFIGILADEIADPSMRRRILENAEFRKLPKIKGS